MVSAGCPVQLKELWPEVHFVWQPYAVSVLVNETGVIYVDLITNEAIDTTVGIIHYSKTGTHIVSAKPIR